MQELGGGNILSAYRQRVMFFLGLLGVIILLPLALLDFLQGHKWLAISILSIAVIMGANAYAAYRKKSPAILPGLLVLTGIVAIGSSLKLQGFYGAFWSYPASLFFYFVHSRRTANLYNLLLASSVTVLVYSFTGIDATIRFVLTMMLTILSSNIFLIIIDTLQNKLLEQSIVDPLTGAMNRRHMDACLEEARERKRRSGRLASLLLFDIDQFKKVNDQFGHTAGDDVLKDVVHVIKDRSRKIDQFFRVGGDEFILLLPDTNEDQAAIAGEHLRESIAEADTLKRRNVSVSVGVSELHADESAESWIHHADEALYRAKQAGRNKVFRRTDRYV